MTPPRSRAPDPLPVHTGWIHLVFFGSGCASLILQVVWFRQLQFVLGSSTSAVSITVASFFFGLSAGGALGGRIADRVARPLRAYAAVELAMSAVSIAVTAVLSRWMSWVGPIAGLLAHDAAWRTPWMVAISFAALLLPTVGMGATLPFVARFAVRHRAALASRIGVLYGVNTLGAATGSFLVGFVLIGLLGMVRTALLASAIYAAIGLSAGWLSSREPPTPLQASNPPGAPVRAPRDLLLAVFAASGLVSISYEIVWFRMLATVSNHTVYAFSGMLAVYLLGLVVGSLLCARALAPHKDRLIRYFALAQLGVAITAMVSVALLGKSRNLLRLIAAVPLPGRLDAWFGDSASFLGLCLLVLLAPTTAIGLTFPLASELTIHRMRVLGRRLGALYAANTLGGVLGSLCTGFVLLPAVGSYHAMAVLIGLNLALFAAVVRTQPDARADRELRRQGWVGLAVVVAGFLAMGPRYLQRELVTYDGARVVDFREAREATYAVLAYDAPDSGPFQQLVVNGKSYASNKPPGRRYMAALAHYPTLFHDDPHRALVICIGTGTTVGALTTYDRLREIDAVDLSRHVFDFAPHFVPLNRRFHEDPRVRRIVADGRHFLLSTHRRFDVLTFEPPPPHDAGVVNLYSEEFYALAQQRMNPGALLAQWAPMDMGRRALPQMVLQALLARFPHVSLWIPSRMEGVAIASRDPLQIDPARLARRMAEPAVARDLREVGITSPEHLLATFVAADEGLRAWLDGAPSVTDDRPNLEYHNLFPIDPIRVDELIALRQPVSQVLSAPVEDPERLRESIALIDHMWLSHEAFFAGDYALARRHLDRSLSVEPDNAYLGFLDRRLKREGF